MELKFPFKFVHRSDNELIYTAELNAPDVVEVSWDIDGKVDNVSYSYQDVCSSIRTGSWVIIEDATENDPLVEIRQSEYDEMVDQINLLQELLAEANRKFQEVEVKHQFKPIKDMNIEDWNIAGQENHIFKARDGRNLFVVATDRDSIWCVCTGEGWHKANGRFDDDNEHPYDIIERVM